MSKTAIILRNVRLGFEKLWRNIETMPFYAVAKGRTPGIFMSWADCEAQVKGFSGAKYKKFDTVESAQDFISSNTGNGSTYKGSKSKIKSNANTSKPNLKRTFTTSSSSYPNSSKPNTSTSKPTKSKDEDNFESSDEDLDAVLHKQLDYIEKQLKSMEKGVDKIIKSAAKGPARSTILIEPPQPKRSKNSNNNEFEVDSEGYVQVYTDGACTGNGRNGARAGIGVYWSEGHSHNVSEPVSGRATNNCAEIQAATRAIQLALQSGVKKLKINTDSQFLINSVVKWMPGWKRKGWKLASGEPVKNEIDFKELDTIQGKLDIKWNYVEAHVGIHGNEMADQLAKAGAALYKNK